MTAASSLRRTPSAPAVVGYVRAAVGQSPVPQSNRLMRTAVAEVGPLPRSSRGREGGVPPTAETQASSLIERSS